MRMMKKSTLAWLLATLALIAVQNPAEAGIIRSPTAAVAASGSLFGSPNDTINQSGLSSGFTSGVTDFDTYDPTNVSHAGGFSGVWISGNGFLTPPQFMTYDLGSSFAIERVAFWQQGGTGSQINAFEIFADDDGSPVDDLGTSIGAFNPTMGTTFGQVFNITDVSTQFLHMRITSGQHGTSTRPAIGEFAVDQTVASTPVPEPSTYALFLTGLAAVGIMNRRRKRYNKQP